MKKKALLAAIGIICITIATSETLAYFTSEDTAHNIITSGGIDIEVVEKTKGDNDILLDFPEDGMKDVLPGSTVSKIVQVQNNGASEAWIRVSVKSIITDEDGNILPLIVNEENKPVLNYNVLDGWVDGDDGYFYYKYSVPSDVLTDVLLEEVKFETTMGNEYQNSTANIIITAQAVQTANNGSSALEAKGWPAESVE